MNMLHVFLPLSLVTSFFYLEGLVFFPFHLLKPIVGYLHMLLFIVSIVAVYTLFSPLDCKPLKGLML